MRTNCSRCDGSNIALEGVSHPIHEDSRILGGTAHCNDCGKMDAELGSNLVTIARSEVRRQRIADERMARGLATEALPFYRRSVEVPERICTRIEHLPEHLYRIAQRHLRALLAA